MAPILSVTTTEGEHERRIRRSRHIDSDARIAVLVHIVEAIGNVNNKVVLRPSPAGSSFPF